MRYSFSNNEDVSGNHGGEDCWTVKLDSNGTTEWQKAIGGSFDDEARFIEPVSDDGFIMAGLSFSDDGDVSENQGADDYYIVKLAGIATAVTNSSTTDRLLKLFPVPATDELMIRTSFNENELVISDVAGYRLYEQPVSGTTNVIDLSMLEPGVYVISITGSGNLSVSARFIKM